MQDRHSRESGNPGNHYWNYFLAMFSYSLSAMLRQKRLILAAVISLAPILIVPVLAFFAPSDFAEKGSHIFTFLLEHLYLKALAPLLALFYGCMLVGEDVELQTIPYLLTRPIPRGAIILGRYACYVFVTSAILCISVLLLFFACTALGSFPLSMDSFALFGRYGLICVAAVASYGALALFLGAMTRHPVIIGIAFIFGWQPFAMLIPGAVDFLTIEKYLWALLPPLATQRNNPAIKNALMEYQKQFLYFSTTKSLCVLGLIVVAFVAATALVLRRREYSGARALGA